MAAVKCGLDMLDEIPSKCKRICIETLIKILKNVETNPNEVKYRTLKKSNKKFYEEVWQHEGARLIMLTAGWEDQDEVVVLPVGISVQESLDMLLQNRNVKPNESEWVDETKVIIKNPEKEKEEELRRRAMAEKEKEMARLKRDMNERKAIAARIMQEHRNDQEERRISRAAAAAPRGEGGCAKFSDIKPPAGG